MVKDYLIYIVACSDSRFYIGVINNLERKLAEHNSGLIKGYTSNLPAIFRYQSDN